MQEKTLTLNLKAKWYNLIESGEKKEEYRLTKDFWVKRLAKSVESYKTQIESRESVINDGLDNSDFITEIESKPFTKIRFVYGYQPNHYMEFKFDSLYVGVGNKEWGAPDFDVFIIKIGERVK